MKILIITDLHSDEAVLKKLELLLATQKFDLALLPGDIQNPHPKNASYTEKLAAIFLKNNLPWFAVHGNNDPREVIDYLKEKQYNLHFSAQTFQDYKFIGLGGWGDELPPYHLDFDQKTIFMTHIPPFILPNSPIPKNQPLIHLSGHKHSVQRIEKFGATQIAIIPSAKTTSTYAVLELPSQKITFHQLPKISLI